MSDVLRVARFYWVLLAIFTVGRWVMSVMNHPYDKGHHVFSIVILTFLSVVFFAAFCRAWRGYTLGRAAMLGAVIGFSAQVVIFASTVISYLLGLDTYFNHPQALNVETALSLGEALKVRGPALIIGAVVQAIVGVIGWALGGLLPRDTPPR